jgi:hypothetical protein
MGVGLKRNRFFHFREKRKSCKNGVIFAKFRFAKIFVSRKFSQKFSFARTFSRKFLPKNCEKVWSKYDDAKK